MYQYRNILMNDLFLELTTYIFVLEFTGISLVGKKSVLSTDLSSSFGSLCTTSGTESRLGAVCLSIHNVLNVKYAQGRIFFIVPTTHRLKENVL